MSSGASPLLQEILGSSNTLPVANSGAWGTPTMQGEGFNWYGGQPLVPEGGYYNQMAQLMAGPSYAPANTNWYSRPQLTPYQTATPFTMPSFTTPQYGQKGASANAMSGLAQLLGSGAQPRP